MNYYLKYLKYKNKYLDLKKILGGSNSRMRIPSLGEPTLMTTQEVIDLKIRYNKRSDHSELKDYIFLTESKSNNMYLVTMLKLPAVGEPTIMTLEEVMALKIRWNKKSHHSGLKDYIFLTEDNGNDSYLVTILKLPLLNKPTIMTDQEVIALKIKYETKKSVYPDLRQYQFVTENKGNSGFLVTMTESK